MRNTSSNSNTKRVLMILNILLIVGLVGTTVYFYLENRDLNKQINLTDQQKRDNLVAEIDKIYELPDEQPEIVVVTDPEVFKREYTTFEDVEKGDNLLVFRKARLGVLYRQNENRVVKTTSVVIPISIELVGSQKAIDEAEGSLSEFGSQITVKKTVQDGVTQSFVFDVDADQEAESQSIATQLELEIGSTLPTSIEPAPATEIVVVVADSTVQDP